mgnify:CR=1 FL=1
MLAGSAGEARAGRARASRSRPVPISEISTPSRSLDELDVPRAQHREARDLGDLVEPSPPAGKRLVDRLAMVEVGLVGGELVRLAAVRAGGSGRRRAVSANAESTSSFVSAQPGDPVQADRVRAARRGSAATAAPLAAGDRSELTAQLAQALPGPHLRSPSGTAPRRRGSRTPWRRRSLRRSASVRSRFPAPRRPRRCSRR